MEERYYCIAGIRYRICCPKEWMYGGDYHLTNFRTEPGPWDHSIHFSVEETLPAPAGEQMVDQPSLAVYRQADTLVIYEGGRDPYLRLQWSGNETQATARRACIPGRITIKLVLAALFLTKKLIRQGGFMLHSSYICHDGKAILFTAPSGTGKSTQADLWGTLRGAKLLNGDRACVMSTPEGVMVHGVPFSGSSGVSENVSAPLAAIVYLSQAPVTTITRLTGLRAFRSVWEGCSVDLWDRAETTACTDLVLEVIRQVPVFHLACTPDESAVNAVERAILELR